MCLYSTLAGFLDLAFVKAIKNLSYGDAIVLFYWKLVCTMLHMCTYPPSYSYIPKYTCLIYLSLFRHKVMTVFYITDVKMVLHELSIIMASRNLKFKNALGGRGILGLAYVSLGHKFSGVPWVLETMVKRRLQDVRGKYIA